MKCPPPSAPSVQALLTPDEMSHVDAMAAQSGMSSFDLMLRAGHAVAASALARFSHALRFVVLCGPGNNGGDGYIAAECLRRSGAQVQLYRLGDVSAMKGDAKLAARYWSGDATQLEAYRPSVGDVVIDAIFGAGLSRPVPPVVTDLIARVTASQVPVLAVDLPSGINGLSGHTLGAGFAATCTVTFMVRKPGHLLLPGRALCGDIEVHDIGIPRRIIDSVAGRTAENGPALWSGLLSVVGAASHKYRRGHLAVFSGGMGRTGAARLSATAGLKAGAGLVTVASPADAMAENAAHLTAVMLREVDQDKVLPTWLETARLSAVVLGPGFGLGRKARDFVAHLRDHPLVLDADGITAFKEDPSELFALFSNRAPRLVLTPHEGEFGRLFPDLLADADMSKIDKARAAATRANAVIVYKGADTVIASPDGRAAINANGPPWLATAGSGDVLAGMIGALLAQGMPTFEAAAAGVYMHGEAAHLAGPAMTAEDLAGQAGNALFRIAP